MRDFLAAATECKLTACIFAAGVLGVPSAATAEKGERMFEAAATGVADALLAPDEVRSTDALPWHSLDSCWAGVVLWLPEVRRGW